MYYEGDLNILKIYTDGASKGNPGRASIGVSVLKDNQEVLTVSEAIGVQTNNFAEYTALIRALEVLSKQYKGESIEVYADSELMIKQLKGVYKVKNENIKPLYAQIQKLLPHFSSISFTHIRREFNGRADELANLAL